MSLYDEAVGQLADDREAWLATRELLSGVVGPSSLNHSGAAVVSMIESENHLSESPDDLEPELLKAVLLALAAVSWPSEVAEIRDAYEQCVRSYDHRAPAIQVAPSQAYRYLNGPGLFEAIAKALDGANQAILAGELRRLLSRAHNESVGVPWTDVVQFITSADVWGRLPREAVRLGFSRTMFVTFDGTAACDRASAARMHSALALWKPLQRCFIQVQYALRPDDELKFPTFVEAGWFRFFRSAALREPHGWTLPHDGEEPRQPEAVALTVTLDRVDAAGLSVLRA